ncbi:uncharacterized protein [Clytia hemisphaerica]|uniref:uncharacterized protein n=1 Tax=Clytia hemisphaerica TaxID=252671 RepID=UPI0034D45680
MAELSPATKRPKKDKENIPESNINKNILHSKLPENKGFASAESKCVIKDAERNDKEEEQSSRNLIDDSESESDESDAWSESTGGEKVVSSDDNEDLDSEDENNTVIEFDIGGNHKYQCDNGGRFQKYYVDDDGTEFYGSQNQAHQRGLSWSQNGHYTCCSAVLNNTSYKFKLEPWNEFDKNAVKIIGKQTKEMVGYVPRPDNLEVKKWLDKQKTDDSIVIAGKRSCGRVLEITCVINKK